MAKAARKDTPPATTSMREQIHEFKRNQVLNEAAALFYDEGYHATTLNAIAQRLGVTKPFIYYHFENKAEILAELCRPTIEKVNQTLDEALAAEGSTATRLYQAIVAITEATLKDQRITTIYFREEKNFTPDAIAVLNQMRKSFDNKLRILLDEGIDKGEFQVADSRFCSQAISGMINWSFMWFKENGRFTMLEVSHQMAALAIQMVTAKVTLPNAYTYK